MQSTLLGVGSPSTKFNCTGEGKRLVDCGFILSPGGFEGLLPLLEDGMEEGAAAWTSLNGSLCSALGFSLVAEACLFGGGDIDLFLDDKNAS